MEKKGRPGKDENGLAYTEKKDFRKAGYIMPRFSRNIRCRRMSGVNSG
jgi:hypothetical protein